MKSVKAILVGGVFIIAAILLLQLLFIFMAVGYNALAKDYPVLHEGVVYLRYLVGIPVFMLIMSVGGYITAMVANMQTSMKIWLNGMLLGSITAGGMLYPLLANSRLTTTGLAIFVLAVTASTAGGLYWRKDNS